MSRNNNKPSPAQQKQRILIDDNHVDDNQGETRHGEHQAHALKPKPQLTPGLKDTLRLLDHLIAKQEMLQYELGSYMRGIPPIEGRIPHLIAETKRLGRQTQLVAQTAGQQLKALQGKQAALLREKTTQCGQLSRQNQHLIDQLMINPGVGRANSTVIAPDDLASEPNNTPRFSC